MIFPPALLRSAALLSVLGLGGISTLSAQEFWTNVTAGSYDFSPGTNWESGQPLTSAATDLRFFANSSASDLVLGGAFTLNNDVSGLTLQRLDLDGQATASGRSVTVNGFDLTLAPDATLNLLNNASSGGNAFGYTFNAGLTLAGNLTVAGSPANSGSINFQNVTLPSAPVTLTVTGGGRVGLNNATLSGDVTVTGSGSGGVTFGGTVLLAGNRTFDTSGASNTILGGIVGDGGMNFGITKTGSGLLSLNTGNHTFTGGITVEAGILALTAGGGNTTHSPAGVTVNQGATLRLDWGGTPPSANYLTNVHFTQGGSLEFGASTGNPSTVKFSGNLTGTGPLRVLARNGKDSVILNGDNSAYSGPLTLESSNPYSALQSQAVIFATAAALPTEVVAVQYGGRVGFSGPVLPADLEPFEFLPFGGLVLSGATGALDPAVSNPMGLLAQGGGITLSNRDNLLNDRLPDTTAIHLDSQSLFLIGRNASNNKTEETIGDLTFSGGSRISLDRLNSPSSGVKLKAASLATPAHGQSLLLDVNSTSDEWGTDASQSHLIVVGDKPAVTNGMVSPGLQYFPTGNVSGEFLTFLDNDLIKATANYFSGFDTNSATEIANLAGATTLAGPETVHALRNASGGDLNLGGHTLTITSGGFITTSKTTSNGTLEFGTAPAFLGAYNGAAQATISAILSGSGGLTILGNSQTLNITNNANTVTGGIAINGGAARLAGNAAHGNDVTVNAFGRLVAGPSGNGTDTIGGLLGSGLVSAWVAGSGTSTGTLAISPTSGTHQFDGTLLNGASGRTLAVTKAGEGTQIFGPLSRGSYTGLTLINLGTLVIHGDFSQATGPVTVASGGTLGGNGRIGGATTVQGHLAPGIITGHLSFLTDLTLDNGASTQMDIGGTVLGESYDAVSVGGNLGYGGSLTLDVGIDFAAGEYAFDLFDFASQSGDFTAVILTGIREGSFTSQGGLWSLSDGTRSWIFEPATGDLDLVIVPEPASFFLPLSVLALLALRRRQVA